MLQRIGNFFGRKPATKSGRLIPEAPPAGLPPQHDDVERRQTFSKVFRWRLPDGQTHDPATVEVAGSFTHWQKVPLTRDGALDSWHATVHNIQGYKTHHYMLLVDGKPAHDKHADGVAPAQGPQEEKYQIMTPRGPRVFMLFAQSK